jgi:hypothetical protein
MVSSGNNKSILPPGSNQGSCLAAAPFSGAGTCQLAIWPFASLDHLPGSPGHVSLLSVPPLAFLPLLALWSQKMLPEVGTAQQGQLGINENKCFKDYTLLTPVQEN